MIDWRSVAFPDRGAQRVGQCREKLDNPVTINRSALETCQAIDHQSRHPTGLDGFQKLISQTIDDVLGQWIPQKGKCSRSVDIIVGIVGAFIGGWLGGALGLHLGSGIIGSLITAFIGAVILLAVLRLFSRGRTRPL
ncbi:transglycosylase associated protein [Paraburkholderia sp. BL27I4N3]|nr:transglycosylase associated protein [Paraburkholderia sp. BL27I4N3]